MQVNLGAATLEEKYTSLVIVESCYWISIMIAVVTCLLLLMVTFLFMFKVFREWRFAICNRLTGRKEQQKLISKGPHV
jgi:hypothetical protein